MLISKKKGKNMNYTYPIRDRDTLKDIAIYMRNNNDRDYVLFALAVYSGLRITDILNLRVKDLKNKREVNVIEKKTGKRKALTINPFLQNILKPYLKNKRDMDYVISCVGKDNKPISRVRAFQIIKNVGEQFDVKLSPHSLRKTFGYFHYQENKDVIILQKIFNHSHPDVTFRYIGVDSETIKKSIDNLRLW